MALRHRRRTRGGAPPDGRADRRLRSLRNGPCGIAGGRAAGHPPDGRADRRLRSLRHAPCVIAGGRAAGLPLTATLIGGCVRSGTGLASSLADARRDSPGFPHWPEPLHPVGGSASPYRLRSPCLRIRRGKASIAVQALEPRMASHRPAASVPHQPRLQPLRRVPAPSAKNRASAAFAGALPVSWHYFWSKWKYFLAFS